MISGCVLMCVWSVLTSVRVSERVSEVSVFRYYPVSDRKKTLYQIPAFECHKTDKESVTVIRPSGVWIGVISDSEGSGQRSPSPATLRMKLFVCSGTRLHYVQDYPEAVSALVLKNSAANSANRVIIITMKYSYSLCSALSC